MYFTQDGINLYTGDMIQGDREATPEEVADYKAKQELSKKVQEYELYLINTAWYVERFNDPSSGKPIPEEVLTKRAEAWEYISANKDAK